MPKAATTHEIEIVVNGQAVVTGAKSVADLVAGQALAGRRIATAVNGQFIAGPQRATTTLNPGDRVEIVSPRQGG